MVIGLLSGITVKKFSNNTFLEIDIRLVKKANFYPTKISVNPLFVFVKKFKIYANKLKKIIFLSEYYCLIVNLHC